MKTKPFLLATAGSTVDGRTIDDKMLDEMAKGYDPKTYAARLNIEHVRGVSGQAPFRAYGDVLELSVGEVDVNFHGKTEKRKALFGVLDVTDEAKALNEAGQKVYPSIEIEPNFAGKGNAYLMGVALTDSPAAIATERLQFNRQVPGTIHLSADEAATLDFADAKGDANDAGTSRIATVLENFFARFAPKADDKSQDDPKTDKQDAFSIAALQPLFQQLGETFSTEIGGLRTEVRGEIDQLGVKLKTVETALEGTPDNQHQRRPAADGGAGDYSGIF